MIVVQQSMAFVQQLHGLDLCLLEALYPQELPIRKQSQLFVPGVHAQNREDRAYLPNRWVEQLREQGFLGPLWLRVRDYLPV